MRTWLAAILTAMLLLQGAAAVAEAADTATAAADGTAVLTASDIAKLGRPASDMPTHITVGSPTRVSGMFFTDMWGNNTSDMDVRTLLHGYSTVAWTSQVQFVTDPVVVREMTAAKKGGNVVYTFALQTDLTYNDGQTPITAKDYVFYLLLCASPEAAALGADASRYEHIAGYDAYRSGQTDTLAGVRLIDAHTFSIAVSAGEAGIFNALTNVGCQPCPPDVLAPGCDVVDTAKGAKLSLPGKADKPLTAEGLQAALFGAGTGYMSHPALTCGPYSLVAFDEATGRVDFRLNPYYKGNYEGVKPMIDTLTLLPADAATMVAQLQSGEFDLLNKCVEESVIRDGLALRGAGFAAENYARLGYGFCAFACEQGPQQFAAVRQAIACSVDREAFVKEYLGDFGIAVHGYYGIGQWMSQAAMGSLRPEGVTAHESAQWDKLNFDGLNLYTPDAAKAKALLARDGWTLNAAGEAYQEGVDTVRYKKVKGGLMRLSIRFAQAQGNRGAEMIVAQLQATLPQLGFELLVDVVPFPDLLADYYRQNGERLYDMNFMATNFLSAFDPYHTFGAEQSDVGTANPSGLYDKKLAQLALKLHRVKPNDYLSYEKSWLSFQQRYNELLPTLPLYSNVYFDFHTELLQNYQPSSYASWPAAILYAYYGEPVAEAPATETPAVDAPATVDTADSGDMVIID